MLRNLNCVAGIFNKNGTEVFLTLSQEQQPAAADIDNFPGGKKKQTKLEGQLTLRSLATRREAAERGTVEDDGT